MARWTVYLARAASNLEHHLDRLKQWQERFDHDAIVVFPYLTYGTTKRLWIKGRVLEQIDIHSTVSDSGWRNLRNNLKRFSTDEIAGARLRVTFHGQNWELSSDEEGFFESWLELTNPCEARLHTLSLTLLSPIRKTQSHFNFVASVLIPSEKARFGIISDIDDTILVSDATHKRLAAQNMLFKNAFTREAFSGVAQFYQQLHQDKNPIFYVSSSPWNVYDVLLQFLELHDIPMGPLLLRDWGLTPEEILPLEHTKHKRASIEHILNTYPDLPFLLLGDSGQEDPEIYQQTVEAFPGRILGVYIRDVTGLERKQSIEAIAHTISRQGSFLELSHDSELMLKDAKARGFV